MLLGSSTDFDGVVKGNNSHGGRNNPCGSNNKPFPVFSEGATYVEACTTTNTIYVEAKSLIATVN